MKRWPPHKFSYVPELVSPTANSFPVSQLMANQKGNLFKSKGKSSQIISHCDLLTWIGIGKKKFHIPNNHYIGGLLGEGGFDNG